MATGPPANPANPTQPPDQNPPQAHVSWDGDRMFNIYILDYCRKRGYDKTAAELAQEADIPSDSQPPINAKQGLLFEWWSVFWVLFAAKSSGQGSEDAILYTQHMNAQAAQRQNQNRIPQQQVNRFMNGIPRQGAAPQPGTMPNGVGPAQVPPPTTMPNGAGPSSQPQLIPGQRPGMPQQRPVNGAPFSSPTMAHSPQTIGGGPGPQPNPAASMSGSMGPSQQIVPMNRGGMLPPNGPQGMPGVRPMAGPHQTPQPAFQPMGPSPNQPGSPSQSGTIMASPSSTTRQPPGMQQLQQEQIAKDMSRLDQNLLHHLKSELGLSNKEDLSLTIDEKRQIIELARSRGRIPKPSPQGPPNAIAGPSGISMSPANQQRSMQMGQSSLQSQPQNMPQQRSVKRNSTSPGEDHAQLPRNESSPPANKRQRTSPPGGEHPQPVIPPQQPQQPQQPQHHQQPPMAPMVPFPHPPQQGGPGGPQLPNGMLRPMVGPMQGFPHPGMPNMGNNPGMAGMPMGGVPHMANQMNPGGMMNPGGPGNMNAHIQYRQSMQNLHKVPQGQMGLMQPANTGSPAGVDNQYNPDGPQSRPGTGVPGQFGGGPPPPGSQNNRLMPKMGMMPPPASPRMTQQKNPAGDPKPGAPGSAPGDMGVPTTSPRNSHPVPGQPQNQGMPGQTAHTPGNHTAPPTPIPANNSMPAPSPSSILGNVSGAMNPQPPPGSSQEFSFGGDLIPGIDDSFNFGGGEDFDRAFGEWFSDTPALDLK